MSHFYGTLQGHRGEATRCGSKDSGITTHAASWAGAIRVDVHVDEDGDDAFIITQVPWHGRGCHEVIASGKIGKQLYDGVPLADIIQHGLPAVKLTHRMEKAG